MKQVNVMQVDMVPGSAVLLYPYFHYLRGAQAVHASLPRRLDVQAIRFLTFRTTLRLMQCVDRNWTERLLFFVSKYAVADLIYR